jgi:hypothetical protein
VLASIDTAANVSADGKTDSTSLTNSQFFATGKAARQLAATPMISDGFKSIAREAILKQQAKAVADTQADADTTDALVGNIIASYSDPATTAAQKSSIVSAAQGAGMDPDGSMTVANFEKKLTAYSSVTPAAQAQPKLKSLQAQVVALLTH